MAAFTKQGAPAHPCCPLHPPLQATAAAVTRGAGGSAASAIFLALTTPGSFAEAFAEALAATGTSEALCAAYSAAKVG